jgi:hypothetical protein
MTRLALLIVVFPVLMLASCDKDDPAGPAAATNSSARCILNGDPFSNAQLIMQSTSHGAWVTTSSGRATGAMDVIGSFSGGDTRRVIFTITIPEAKTGGFAWIDPQGAVLSPSGVFLEIYNPDQTVSRYQPVQGSTTVSKFGNVTEQIEGSFSGTLRNTNDGRLVSVSNGTFGLTRLANQ